MKKRGGLWVIGWRRLHYGQYHDFVYGFLRVIQIGPWRFDNKYGWFKQNKPKCRDTAVR